MTADVALGAKVAALRDPRLYPGPPARVDAIETHMSWVFLADGFAYKLKKARRFDHLDFRSPAARHFYCLEELRLNRRLAPRVYLDVVPLTVEQGGRLALAGPGEVVDWLVKMERLPASGMLDELLLRRAATEADMRCIAQVLVHFYSGQPPAPLHARAYRALLAREIDGCCAELEDPHWELPLEAVRRVCGEQREFLERFAALFDARVAAGRIVEGHGDLRPEHVFMGEPIAIIDALEFSVELRTLDCVDEVGFLALECERAGTPALGRALLRGYEELSGDRPPPELVHFHQSCRAASRARLAIRHLAEARYRSSPQWRLRAQAYLALAADHIARCGESVRRAAAA
jgi:aminoglycoside phosphotransferase family enzyme